MSQAANPAASLAASAAQALPQDPMQFQAPDIGSTFAFVALCALVVSALLRAAKASRQRTDQGPTQARVAVAVAAWVGLVSSLVVSGFVAQQPMPRLLLAFSLVAAAGLSFGLSSWGRSLALGLSLSELVAFQIFRLPLEVILHQWAAQGSIPQTMTWTGQNYDILAGLAALFFFAFTDRKGVAWAFNILGILLLANVVRVVIFSSPLPFAWPVEPKLLIGLHLPYALIGPICVAGALAGHVVLTRKLLGR